MRRKFKGKERITLALLIFSVACIAGIVLYHLDEFVFLYFGDAASHIVKARQFIDSQRPGIQNIGTVWLPLPHFLLLPFVAIDFLFFSGIAGAVVCVPFLVGTSLLLFSIVQTLTGSRPIAFLSACLLGLNPNIMYMALTPMNELSLMFFVALGGFAFLRWLDTDKQLWLLVCAVAVMLASLCRYEAWLLAPFVSVVAVSKAVSHWKQSERKAALNVLAIGAACWLGVVFWLLWNQIEYGDALIFARKTYSVGTIAVRESLHRRPQDLFLILGRAILTIFGPVLLLLSVHALVRVRSTSAKRRPLLLLLFFSLPAVFAFGSIFVGFVQVDKWSWNWRYVLTLALFLSVAGAIGLADFFHRVHSRAVRTVVVVCLLAMPFIQVAAPQVGVATFEDARKGFFEKALPTTGLGKQLRLMYKGGSVALLMGNGQAQRIMVTNRLQLKSYDIIYNPDEKRHMGPIWNIDQYVVIGKDLMPESRVCAEYWLARRNMLLRFYNNRFEDEHFLLLERKNIDTRSIAK